MSKRPKAATAWYDLALFFYNDNKFSKATQYFRKVDFPALTQNQQSEGHFKWGYSYFNLKQLDQALEQFNDTALEQVAREIVNLLGKRLSHKPIEDPGRLLVPTLSVRASS